MMLGSFHTGCNLPLLQINRFGVIPKGYNTGQMETNYGSLVSKGLGVNKRTDPAPCSLSYTTVDDIAATIVGLGKGALLANIKSAYRLIPVHPRNGSFNRFDGTRSMLISCYPSASDKPQRSSLLSATHWSGIWNLRQLGTPLVHHYFHDFTDMGPCL